MCPRVFCVCTLKYSVRGDRCGVFLWLAGLSECRFVVGLCVGI